MKWVTTWGNATSIADHKPETYAKDITLRYPVMCPIGGERVRLHFSNFCGTEPVTFDNVTIAHALNDREVTLNDAQVVTFGGKEKVTIPAGEELYSDEINMRVAPRTKISVSVYLKNFTLMRSGVVITGPLSKGFYSVGNQAFCPILPLDKTRTTNTFYFFTGLDVYTSDENKAIILYGDSITAQSWADYLNIKCMDNPYNTTAVIRRAASGTRVLREYNCITYESYGLCGKHRFEREISTVSGAESVVIQQGINDIIHPVGTDVNPFRPMSDLPTVEELEEGIKYYIGIADKYKLKTYLGTLLPIFGWRTYAPFREEMKNSFNDWARGYKKVAGCIDFDKALRSEENIAAFKEGYDSGDHLHPSEQAYKVMADTAYKELFK
jgi:lysophospholipase L1-like esterase